MNHISSTSPLTRPPIVVVMGHVDHGKTTILDWYRKTKVVDKESGGITQHIAAYEVDHHGKKLTFIDTPGHEAFPRIRARGARIADIAVLVVAADEGVKPQTREAITVIRETNTPFVVAFNKTDRPGANPERVKQELAKEEVLVESYGGKVPSVEISAKTGERMDELLDTILLMAELENLETDNAAPAQGVVLEAMRDPRRGIGATLLIRDGRLKKGQWLIIGNSLEPVKIFEDFLGHSINEAGPSSPIRVSGLSAIPGTGQTFTSFAAKADAEKFLSSLPASPAPESAPAASGEREAPTVFNVIIKADTLGSREALEDALKKLRTENTAIRILKSEIGDINESDAKLALTGKKAVIAGFRVRTDPSVRELIRHAGIRVIAGAVIYELLDQIRDELTSSVPTEQKRALVGRVKILKLFKRDGEKQIVGGRVEEGIIRKGVAAEIVRGDQSLGGAIIRQLQRERSPADEVGAGAECGMLAESKTTIAAGDALAVYEEESAKK